MKQYTTNQSDIKAGDYIIYPRDISSQEINQDLDLEVREIIVEEANLLTFFSGNDFASMYNSTVSKPP